MKISQVVFLIKIYIGFIRILKMMKIIYITLYLLIKEFFGYIVFLMIKNIKLKDIYIKRI